MAPKKDKVPPPDSFEEMVNSSVNLLNVLVQKEDCILNKKNLHNLSSKITVHPPLEIGDEYVGEFNHDIEKKQDIFLSANSLRASHIPMQTTKQQLINLFKRHGVTVLEDGTKFDRKPITKNGITTKYAKVIFSSPTQMKKALSLDGLKIHGQKIYFGRYSGSLRSYVIHGFGNIPIAKQPILKQQLRIKFIDFGTIQKIFLPRDGECFKGLAFIYLNKRSSMSATALTNTLMEGKTITVEDFEPNDSFMEEMDKETCNF